MEKTMSAKPVQTWTDDADVVTFELEDLKTAIVETLRREVKMRLTGLVD
jgi:phosphoribosylaminoimidazole carboxylase (NCAIR synthetase)